MFQPSQPARRSRTRSGIALGLAAAVLAAGASACSGSSSGLGSPDQPNLRVGLVDSIGAVPFQIGSSTSTHAFMDSGLTITVQKFESQQEELAALASDKIDIAYGEYAQFLNGASTLATSGNIRVVSEAYDASTGTIALLKRRGFTLPNWGAGAGNAFNCNGSVSIVVPSKQGTEYLALAAWFQSLGSPLPTNCPAIVANPNPTQAIGAVASGQVTATVLQEPYVTAAQISGGLQLDQDLATGNASAVPVDGYFATKTFVTKYPHTTAIFAADMAKLQASSGQRVVVETALRSAGGIDSRVIAAMQLGTYPSVVLPAKLDIVLRLMSNAGTVNGLLDSGKLTNLSSNG
ncbi:MAG TPA: ABC transporter substrate-binding protein [Actinocrinis sp.]|nr:ABC transporter substrate-binding protein [Actinocrinis sp.]